MNCSHQSRSYQNSHNYQDDGSYQDNRGYQDEDKIDLLLEYSAGRLDAVRSRELEQHMNDCAACAALRLEQAALWRVLDEYTAPELSLDFNRGVWRKIDAAAAEPWYVNPGRAFREGAWKPVFPLAAAVLLVAAGFVFDHRNGNTSSGVSIITTTEAEQVQNTLEDLQLLQNLNASAAEVIEPIL